MNNRKLSNKIRKALARQRKKKAKKKKKKNWSLRTIPASYSEPLKIQPLKSTRIRHKEFVTDLNFTAVGNAIIIPINPGLDDVFPWLSKIAHGFESYRFNELRFIFEPLVGTDTVGGISISPDYDAADTTQVTKQILMSYEDSVTGPTYRRLIMRCSPKNMRKQKEYFVRETKVYDTDIKTYDTANVIIYSQTTAGAIGGIWVEYDITLYTPQLNLGFQMESLWGESSSPDDNGSPWSDGTTEDGLMEIDTNISCEVTLDTALSIYESGKWIWIMEMLGTGITGNYTPNLTGVTGTITEIVNAYSSTEGVVVYMIECVSSIIGKLNPLILNWAGTAGTTATFVTAAISEFSSLYPLLNKQYLKRVNLRPKMLMSMVKKKKKKKDKSKLVGKLQDTPVGKFCELQCGKCSQCMEAGIHWRSQVNRKTIKTTSNI